MKTTGKDRSMTTGDRREPGDVYMMLSPEGEIRVISTSDIIYKRFTDFVNDGAFYALRDRNPSYENDFFVQYRFPDSKKDSGVGSGGKAHNGISANSKKPSGSWG